MRRYARRFAEALDRIDAEGAPAPEKLDAYAALYAEVLRGERMCLCGMLAAEYDTLPPRMRTVVLRFFDENERWLVGALESGRQEGTLTFDQSAPDAAD